MATHAALNVAVERLKLSRDRLARLSVPERIALLERMIRDTRAVAEDWVRVACWAKGLEEGSPAAAEEWLGGPVTVLRNLRLLRDSLRDLARGQKPRLGAVATLPNGRVAVQVHPSSLPEKLLLQGFTAETRLETGVTADQVQDLQATAYPVDPDATGRTCLVLGAGNVASIGPMDVLYKTFVEGAACLLKLNPVNDYLDRFVEKAFAALVEPEFLKVVKGDAEAGAHLVHHKGVDEVHITGSTRIHDVIVWGPEGPEQDANRAAGTPVVDKTITSELGCVTPVIVVPGDWTEAELDFQADSIASQVVNNASFNCNAAKVLVTAAGWKFRDALIERIEARLAATPPRRAYYPGSEGRWEAWTAAHDARTFGERTEAQLPWAVARDLDPTSDAHGFSNEAWCGVLAETGLTESGPEAFLAEATRFCNERVWGTLSCSVVLDPRTQKLAKGALERALEELRYGSVAVNHWPALSYGLVATPWGAYPGHTLDDVQSGIGVVHDTPMLTRTEKAVVRGPFVAKPKPPWLVTHRQAHVVARRMAGYEASGSPLALPGLALAAFRG